MKIWLPIIMSSVLILSACGGGSDSVISNTDTQAPIIILNGSSEIELTEGSTYSELGATASDNVDTNVKVTISGSVNTSKVGSYIITYIAKDAAGNEAKKVRTIIVKSIDSVTGLPALSAVDKWFYHLGFDPTSETINKMVNSQYDMVVIEPIFTEKEHVDFPIKSIVDKLHNAPHPKLSIAYVDVGQAEEWRTYWKMDWKVGNPIWIVSEDPDGWEGNYPVAYWDDEWKKIWMGPNGQLKKLINAGFDGIYLDWIEAYSNEKVASVASNKGLDAKAEMVKFIKELADYARKIKPGFLVIGQNSAELARDSTYLETVDAIAQEQVWFEGAPDGKAPQGDCPLPATDSDISTEAYKNSLSNDCKALYEEQNGESTLSVSSEGYINDLLYTKDQGLKIFTIDYALKPENINTAISRSLNYGFVPFTSNRALDIYVPVK